MYSSQLSRFVRDWSTFYHLGFARFAFLGSVRHLIRGRVLEIGAECGALTRFLGETGSEVVAVEAEEELAEAARLRCQGLPNVTVVSEASAGPYDVILTRGAADWPLLRSMLAPDGRLIVIAASKPLGLEEAGLHCEFGFLFPDYEAPQVVLSSAAFAAEALDLVSFFDARTIRYPRPGYVARNWAELQAAGSLMDSASGFLVVASLQKPAVKAFPGLVYLYSTNRTAAFAKESVIEMNGGEMWIRRHPLVSDPEPVENPVCRRVLEDELWLTGEPYDRGLTTIVQVEGWRVEQIAAWARPWVEFLRASLCDGRTILPQNYLDCTPFNLIVESSGRLRPFDLEYAAVEPLELELVVFRGLWGALTRQDLCADPQPGSSTKVIRLVLEVMRSLEMDLPESRVAEFVDWEARLQHQVTGTAARRAAYVLRQQPLSLRNSEKTGQKRFLCQLFWRGPEGGYQEQESAASLGEITDERQTLLIPIPALPGDAAVLRWDMADRPGILRVHSLDLLDSRDDVVWSMRDFPGSLALRAPSGAQVIPPIGNLPLSFILTGTDPSIELAADPSQVRRLAEGGTLVVDCAWVGEK